MSDTTSDKRRHPRNLCLSCRHYFLTYEPRQPYGCRGMGFRSAKAPSLVAFETSGIPCQLMEPKSFPLKASKTSR